MKILMGVAVLGVAVLLMTGCDQEQRRRETQQEWQQAQQLELERLQESQRQLIEYQNGQDRILESMRESERLRNEINQQANERLLEQQRLQKKYRPAAR